jgi:hypothetical protein
MAIAARSIKGIAMTPSAIPPNSPEKASCSEKVKVCDVIPPTPLRDRLGYVRVHRIYCFDFYNSEPEPAELERIFESLPGYRRECGWRWFEESTSYLSASSDFNGLTVVGILREADWHAWDAAFQGRAGHLPMQEGDW